MSYASLIDKKKKKKLPLILCYYFLCVKNTIKNFGFPYTLKEKIPFENSFGKIYYRFKFIQKTVTEKIFQHVLAGNLSVVYTTKIIRIIRMKIN